MNFTYVPDPQTDILDVRENVHAMQVLVGLLLDPTNRTKPDVVEAVAHDLAERLTEAWMMADRAGNLLNF